MLTDPQSSVYELITMNQGNSGSQPKPMMDQFAHMNTYEGLLKSLPSIDRKSIYTSGKTLCKRVTCQAPSAN